MEEQELTKMKCLVCGEEYLSDFSSGATFEINESGEKGKEVRIDVGFVDTYAEEEGFLFDLQQEGGWVCSYCSEHVRAEHDTVTVVGPKGQESLAFEGRLAYYRLSDGIEEYQEIAEVIARHAVRKPTNGWQGYLSIPGDAGLTKVLSGWHSSLESSALSDKINALIEGDIELDYPVAIAFTGTSNVYSIGLDVYAPADKVEEVKALLDEQATPAYAGF